MSEDKISFEDFLEKDGVLVYTNRGFSMMPMLRQKRDLIVVKKISSEPLKRYDVVLFKYKGNYVLHRIMKIDGDDFTTAGDHNWWKEYHIQRQDIIGKLDSFVRDGKEIKTDNKFYLCYVHLWCDLFPVRAGILKASATIKRLGSYVKHHI